MLNITPRERFHRIVDKESIEHILLDFGGMSWSIIDGEPYGYRSLCDYLEIDDVIINRRHGSNIVYPIDERVYEKLHIDFRHLRMGEPKRTMSSDTVLDAWGVERRRRGDNWYPTDYPLKDIRSEEEIEKYDGWPDPGDPVYTKGIRGKAREISENTQYILSLDPGEARGILARYSRLRGFNQTFIDMKRKPELFHTLISRIVQVNIDLITPFLNEVGDYADVIFIADDLGGQTHPFFSPIDLVKYYKPYLKDYIKAIKRIVPKLKVIFHSDGAIFPLIGELIDAGIDILNPLQPGAKDMQPEKLVSEYGEKLCFHGGIDVQHILPHGDVEEVKSLVIERIDSLLESGYIIAPSQAISADIPPKNVYTMYETAYNYGLIKR